MDIDIDIDIDIRYIYIDIDIDVFVRADRKIDIMSLIITASARIITTRILYVYNIYICRCALIS